MKKIISLCLLSFMLLVVHAQKCPVITVQAPSEVTAGDTLEFNVEVKNTDASISYNWSISAGTIISGQGTPLIQVTTNNLGGMTVTATVEIGGISRDCSSTSSSTTNIIFGPEKIISANYTSTQALTAAVQKFITETDFKNPDISQTAFIYLYEGITSNANLLKAISTAIANEFQKNSILPYQFKIVPGGRKKMTSFEMYRLMAGAAEPRHSH